MKKPLTEAEQQALAYFREALQSFLGENLLSLRLFRFQGARRGNGGVGSGRPW